jgi:cysteine-S-conjugate beta-lyase
VENLSSQPAPAPACGPDTGLVHHGYRAPADFEAVPVGVYKASTVLFPNVAAMRSRKWVDKSAYTYGLHGTPTTFVLEERLATLEGGRHCILAPSGLAAIGLVDLAFLQQGDEVLIPRNAYGPNASLARHELARWGIGHRFYDPMRPQDLADQLSERSRLVWLEAAGSVTLEFPDVPALMQVVRSFNQRRAEVDVAPRPLIAALDNTWGAGVAFAPFDWGVDVSMQALTKYPSGGADVLMGAVVTRDLELHQELLMTHMRLGLNVAGNDAELVLRGLPSLHLRYRAQDAAARRLAAWAQTQPGVARVFHPALPDSPGHAFWKRDARGAACLFSLAFEPDVAPSAIDAFCDRLTWFRLGYSWAGPMSLCVPYDMPGFREGPWPYAPTLVRLAVGLENVDDLQRDLAQALLCLRTA